MSRQPIRSEFLPAPAFEEQRPCSCGFAMVDGGIQTYNEEAFRYFLNVERRRAERSARPLLLLLIGAKGSTPGRAPIEDGLAHRLFGSLSQELRETDFVGWYREGRIAGAVLMLRADSEIAEVSRQVVDRVTRVLASNLPRSLSERLQLRIFRLPFSTQGSR